MTTSLLFDQIKVALADPERRLKGTWDPKDPRARPLLKQLNDKLTKAVRFDLDPSFAALTETCSLLPPRKLAYLFGESRAPYDVMWVEWEVAPTTGVLEAWRASRADATGLKMMGPINQRPDSRTGLLIERETRFAGRESVYRLTSFACGDDRPDGMVLVMWPIGIVWDPIQGNLHEVMSHDERVFCEDMWKAQPNHMTDTFGVFWTMGWGETDVEVLHDMEDKLKASIVLPPKDKEAFEYLTAHCRYVPAGAFGLMMNGDKGWKKSTRMERFRNLAHEGTGDMRFTAALLGLMNTYEIVVGPSSKPPNAPISGERVVWGKRVPYLAYHRLTLKLPKGKPIEARVRDFSPTLIHKRAHMVRGHNRYYKATGKRVWIKPHQRGDASLGFVKKDYLVQATDGGVP